jgi:hypothetical protein
LKRFNKRESIVLENVSSSGRQLKIWKRGDRQIVRVARTNRRDPLSELTCIVNQSLPQNISSRTDRRRLRFHKYWISEFRGVNKTYIGI